MSTSRHDTTDEPVRVLVVGSPASNDASDWWAGPFPREDVDLVWWTSLDVLVAAGDVDRAADAVLAGAAVVDLSPVDDFDVLLFRGSFDVSWTCLDCPSAFRDRPEATGHAESTGHLVAAPGEPLVGALLRLLEERHDLLRGRTLAYAPDGARPASEDDIEHRLAATADLLLLVPDEDETAWGGAGRILRVDPEGGWAAALRSSAEIGGPAPAFGETADAAPWVLADRALRRLDHRRSTRAGLREAPVRLAMSRKAAELPRGGGNATRVTVVVLVDPDRWEQELPVSVGSARMQSTDDLEILVAIPDDGAAVAIAAWAASLADPRIRAVTIGPGHAAETASGGPGTADANLLNAIAPHATGAWLAPLPGGSLFTPDHVSRLLAAAQAGELEAACGRALIEDPSGAVSIASSWPGGGVVLGTELVSTRLSDVRWDPDAWLDGASPSTVRWRWLAAAGASLGWVDEIVLVGARQESG